MSNLKLTVLIDNNTIIDRYFLAEPALAYYLELNDQKILFDTGYSDAFIDNAIKLGIDLKQLDQIIISHGHIDHTGGLEALSKFINEDFYENKAKKTIDLIYHPLALQPKMIDGHSIGLTLGVDYLSATFNLKPERKSFEVTDHLFYLGQIPRKFGFEAIAPIGHYKEADQLKEDYLLDDTAIVYKGSEGLVIITGCSHSGICNIIEQAKRVTNTQKIQAIIGGFHLLDEEESKLKKIKAYFLEQDITILYPCHCTDFRSKKMLSTIHAVETVGSGLQLTFE
jgi:7,8-dihydropterin-6-yl-methyl-4-(beta-D-ribofuranosyl)aminobenzene 5'-phosphate synthase